MKCLITALILFFTLVSFAQQIDSLNTTNNKLEFGQLNEATNTYLVYFQDSVDAPKRNMEIWERTITKTKVHNKEVYQFLWDRFFSNGSNYKYKILANANDFSPISEEVVMNQLINNDSLAIRKRHYIYEGNSMYTSTDKNKHNGAPFRLDALENSFNFEMDMETFSMLPLEEGKSFALKFYHPGSKTPPKYYTYAVDRSEKLLFNNDEYDCWVLKVIYAGFGHAEFWIDKKTNATLQMREVYRGLVRYKVLVV
ncbi:MAG: hypothetical protein MI974_09940 [Chitinophagales bacterium]|nr:hypothetical protein [Chitinophagales bacterium]